MLAGGASWPKHPQAQGPVYKDSDTVLGFSPLLTLYFSLAILGPLLFQE